MKTGTKDQVGKISEEEAKLLLLFRRGDRGGCLALVGRRLQKDQGRKPPSRAEVREFRRRYNRDIVK
jgi:hypothetical protein